MPDLRNETLVEGRVRSEFTFEGLRCPDCGVWARTEADFIEQANGDHFARCRCCECAKEWDVRPHRVPARVHAQVASGEEGKIVEAQIVTRND